MARIVVLTHEYDRFLTGKDSESISRRSTYLLSDVLEVLLGRGHTVRVQAGPDGDAQGDAVIVHVDCSVTPEPYLEFAARFPLAVNARIADIRKRAVSGALLSRGEDWAGPVIVKADLNSRGSPEAKHNTVAQMRGHPRVHPYTPARRQYRMYPDTAQVPLRHWNDPRVVVEKFVPERDGDNYAIRNWVFLGPAERCKRSISADPMVKAEGIVSRDDAEVPPELRAERERLGFDFGKFDFVIHGGRAVLLDANKTPGATANIRPALIRGAPNLADGFEALLA